MNFFKRRKPVTAETGVITLDVSTRGDVQLGRTAKHKITGFEGVVVYLSHEIDGSLLVGVQPRALDGGKPAEIYDFDAELLEISGAPAVMPAEAKREHAITLGAKYRDKITGFTGRAVRMVEFIGGCAHISLSPEVDEKGKIEAPLRTPVERVERIDEARTEAPEAPPVTPTKTGGPGDSQRSVSRMSSH